ncbi:MAG: type II secretion system protein [Verrucomicrobiota bacterium]
MRLQSAVSRSAAHRWARIPTDPRRMWSRRTVGAFTLVELLTVITILAILATLLMTTLGSVKRKAREAVCISNLHQIGLALNLYLEDFHQRPTGLEMLVTTKYLPDPKILACPADKSGLLMASAESSDTKSTFSPASNAGRPPHVSYQHPLQWAEADWSRLMQLQTRAGVVVCTFHDIRGHPGTSVLSSDPPQGLILRGQLDGAVVRRQFFKAETVVDSIADRGAVPPAVAFGDSAAAAGNNTPPATTFTAAPPWEYFTDEPAP